MLFLCFSAELLAQEERLAAAAVEATRIADEEAKQVAARAQAQAEAALMAEQQAKEAAQTAQVQLFYT